MEEYMGFSEYLPRKGETRAAQEVRRSSIVWNKDYAFDALSGQVRNTTPALDMIDIADEVDALFKGILVNISKQNAREIISRTSHACTVNVSKWADGRINVRIY